MKFKKAADKLYEKLQVEEKEGKLRYYRPREVYPIIERDGSIKWFNLLTGGKWWNLFVAIILMIITIGLIFEYTSNLNLCTELIEEKNLEIHLNNLNKTLEIPIYLEHMRLAPNWTRVYGEDRLGDIVKEVGGQNVTE